jgi:hypothetical protein
VTSLRSSTVIWGWTTAWVGQTASFAPGMPLVNGSWSLVSRKGTSSTVGPKEATDRGRDIRHQPTLHRVLDVPFRRAGLCRHRTTSAHDWWHFRPGVQGLNFPLPTARSPNVR